MLGFDIVEDYTIELINHLVVLQSQISRVFRAHPYLILFSYIYKKVCMFM